MLPLWQRFELLLPLLQRFDRLLPLLQRFELLPPLLQRFELQLLPLLQLFFREAAALVAAPEPPPLLRTLRPLLLPPPRQSDGPLPPLQRQRPSCCRCRRNSSCRRPCRGGGEGARETGRETHTGPQAESLSGPSEALCASLSLSPCLSRAGALCLGFRAERASRVSATEQARRKPRARADERGAPAAVVAAIGGAAALVAAI